MRRVLCVASAGLMVLCISKAAVGQEVPGAAATAGTPETVAGSTGPLDGPVLPTHRVVRRMTICATAALLQQYAFASEYPKGVRCERLGPDALLLWSGEREATLIEGLFSVARVVAQGGAQSYTFAASLDPIMGSKSRGPSLGAIGYETGYDRLLGSNHFGRNVTPSAASLRLSGTPGG
jgi:hypothetical protein